MGHNGGQVRFRGMDLFGRGLGILQVALLNDIFCIAGTAKHAIGDRKEQWIIVMIGFFEAFLLLHVLALPSPCSQTVSRSLGFQSHILSSISLVPFLNSTE